MSTLSLEGLSVEFRRGRSWVRAVRDVSMAVEPGEALGVVGESGSGKSTVALAGLRYLPRNGRLAAGRVLFEGRDMASLSAAELRAVRGARIGAVYQNPGAALNGGLTVGRQVAEMFETHAGLTRAQAHDAAVGMLDRVRIRDPRGVADLYPHEISGGMQQRVVIAMALATDPALLILDEPTTALDATVQAEILALFRDLRRRSRAALLFISHNLAVVGSIADRIAVMYAGEVVETAPATSLLRRPAHPYTRALVGCIPPAGADKRTARLVGIEGLPPDPAAIPAGCGFSPRCPVVQPDCTQRHPPPLPSAIGQARCWHMDLTARIVPPPAPATVRPAQERELQARGVTRRLGRRDVLRGLDVDIARGETFGLVGESGSGKSTFARVVAGLLAATGGTLTLEGQALPRRAARRDRATLRAVQMVFQSPDTTLNPRQSVGAALRRAVRRLSGLRGAAVGARVEELLAAVSLPPALAGSRPGRLSGGQRQRVAIARAFAGEPRLVILDEPTSALDVSVQASVVNLLADLQVRGDVAYLFISHDLAIVRYLSDRIAVLAGGVIVEEGSARTVFDHPASPVTRTLLAASRALERVEETTD